jgi:hypothetical protein
VTELDAPARDIAAFEWCDCGEAGRAADPNATTPQITHPITGKYARRFAAIEPLLGNSQES